MPVALLLYTKQARAVRPRFQAGCEWLLWQTDHGNFQMWKDHADHTTHTLDGQQISEYLGLVSGEAILGANIFKDFFADIRDIVGERSAAYEQELRKAKRYRDQGD